MATAAASKRAVKAVGRPSDSDFQWTTPAGIVVTVPSMSKMDPDMDAVSEYAEAASAGRGNPILDGAAAMRFLRASLPAESSEQVGKLKLSEFQAFLSAWSEHSGVSLGESAAS